MKNDTLKTSTIKTFFQNNNVSSRYIRNVDCVRDRLVFHNAFAVQRQTV